MNFSRVTNLLPHFSILTLAVVSVFNVGFFTEVGIHFIGVVDITNLVYSFGLVFPILLGVAQIAGSGIPFFLIEFARSENSVERFSRFRRVLVPVLFIITFLLIVANAYLGWRRSNEITALFIFIVIAVIGVSEAIAFVRNGAVNLKAIVLASSFAFILVFYVGRAVAREQIRDESNSYFVSTKNFDFPNAHIIRSSSSGFLVVLGGRIAFLPTEQIKFVRSNAYIK